VTIGGGVDEGRHGEAQLLHRLPDVPRRPVLVQQRRHQGIQGGDHVGPVVEEEDGAVRVGLHQPARCKKTRFEFDGGGGGGGSCAPNQGAKTLPQSSWGKAAAPKATAAPTQHVAHSRISDRTVPAHRKKKKEKKKKKKEKRNGAVFCAGPGGDEVVQVPQPGADCVALAEVLHQEEDAEEQVEECHFPREKEKTKQVRKYRGHGQIFEIEWCVCVCL